MSKEHIVYRVIDDVHYHCQDVGCDDFDRAEYNRYIVASRLFTTAYEITERWFAHTPLGVPLPAWMPLGRLPQVGKKDWEQVGGAGFLESEELNEIVVGG